jgi:epoxyqueuosine reductase
MDYLARTHDVRSDPRAFFPKVRSIICVAVPYELSTPPPPDAGFHGYVASYARGPDYHRVVGDLLEKLAVEGQRLTGPEFQFRICVDSEAVLERSIARACGLGQTAHNTSLMVGDWGSRVVLGELFTSVDLEPDPPVDADPCGSCRDCIEACPTGALVEPGVLDARRCLSYQTVEAKGSLPPDLRPAVGSRLFGCDTCQIVCPANAPTAETALPAEPDSGATDLWPTAWVPVDKLIGLGSNALRRLTQDTALNRLSRARLRRNMAVILGNAGPGQPVRALIEDLLDDPSDLVKDHARWAFNSAVRRETP